jgi:hypothetical protein
LFKRLFSSSGSLEVDRCWLWTISPSSRLCNLVWLEGLGSEKLLGLSSPILSPNAVSTLVTTLEIKGWLRIRPWVFTSESPYWCSDSLSIPRVTSLVLGIETFARALWRFWASLCLYLYRCSPIFGKVTSEKSRDLSCWLWLLDGIDGKVFWWLFWFKKKLYLFFY